MDKIRLKQKMRKGRRVLGPWCVLPDINVMSVIASSGLDFIIIDMEHGPIGFDAVQTIAATVKSEGVAIIVRLSDGGESNILHALDIGVDGILVPHVHNENDVKQIIRYSKYHPMGNRGFSPYTRAGAYGSEDFKEYVKLQNEETLIGVILEDVTDATNVRDILRVEHLDLVYVGAYDLSQSIGMPGEVRHPKVMSIIKECINEAKRAGISVGGHVAGTPEDIEWMCGMGMNFITILPDVAVIQRAFAMYVESFRKCYGEVEKIS